MLGQETDTEKLEKRIKEKEAFIIKNKIGSCSPVFTELMQLTIEYLEMTKPIPLSIRRNERPIKIN